MKTLKLVPIVALVIMASLNALAGKPKSETAVESTAVPTETKAKSGDVLYYFLISDNGSAFDSRTTTTSHTTSDCSGDGVYCEVGIPESDVDISGSTVTLKEEVTDVPIANRTQQN